MLELTICVALTLREGDLCGCPFHESSTPQAAESPDKVVAATAREEENFMAKGFKKCMMAKGR